MKISPVELQPNFYTLEVDPLNITSGAGGSVMSGGGMQSPNFNTGVSGWRIDANGSVEFVDGTFTGDITGASGTFSGTLIGGSLHVPDEDTTTSSFHVDSTGAGWVGETTTNRATAPMKWTAAGALTVSNITITGVQVGSSIDGQYLGNLTVDTAAIAADAIEEAKIAADAVTAAKIAVSGLDGTTGDVAANHIVANMLQADCVTTVKLQADSVTAPKINVVGLDGISGRIVVADATDADVVTGGINTHAVTLIEAGKIVISGATNLDDWSHTSDATVIDGGKIYANSVTATQISADTITANEIAANTITATEIAAATITATEMNVATLSAITADLGTITAGNITVDSSGYVKGGQSAYNTGAGFWLGYDSTAYKFSIGDPDGDYFRWTGSVIESSYKFSTFIGGDGSDGDVTHNTGGNLTLTADIYYDDLTITSNSTLIPNGWKIFVRGTLTIDSGSKIAYNGNAGSNGSNGRDTQAYDGFAYSAAGGAGGAALSSNSIFGSYIGQDGQDGHGHGTAGDTGTAGTNATDCIGVVGAASGAGGAGGAGVDTTGGAGGAGGSAGTCTVSTHDDPTPSHVVSALRMTALDIDATTTTNTPQYKSSGGSAGGGSGGAGGNDTNVTPSWAGGGGGGAGGSASSGGCILIVANKLVNNGSIEAKGANGGNGGNGGNGQASPQTGSGGGGGGGAGSSGGVIVIVTNTKQGTGTTDVTPGTGGALGSAGTGGGAGVDGGVGSSGTAGKEYLLYG